MTDVQAAIDVLSNLPERATAERHRRGLSYRRAAEHIGISASSFYMIESGRRSPSVLIALRLLRWLEGDY